jgi:tripeptide aminopeptidase
MHLIERIEKAFIACGVTPKRNAIRGGTDGATLTWMGLPCPNLGTGGYNFHGVHECIPVESLEAMVQVLCQLVGSFIE